MIAIQSSASKKCTPHLLPARLNHNGPVNDADRYWKPEADEQGTPHVYFRGRHLHGTPLPLPSTHTGVVMQITDKNLPQNRHSPTEEEDDDDDGEEQETVEVKIADQIGEFQDVVIWGHGGPVDEGQSMFIRGVREWVGFADAMHGDHDEEEEEQEEQSGKKGV